MASRSEAECPNCGATFPQKRLACPECGSDAETGWKDAEEVEYASVEIPDYYGEADPRPKRLPLLYLVGALLALAGMAVFALLR